MHEFTDVLGAKELAPGEMRKVSTGGRNVLLARVEDDFHAVQLRCPHLAADLSKGTLEGSVVTCPLHGSQFDVTDGTALRWTDWSGALEAVAEALRPPRPLRTYEVRVEGGRVFVGPERASA